MARGRIRRRGIAAAVTAGLTLALLPAAAPAQVDTRATCPGTFHVLHNDSIGKLRLNAGAYTITVLNPAQLTCAKASQNFAEFLQDYDGRLRRPWIVNTATATFTRGPGSTIGFTVARAGAPSPSGGGNNNPTSNTCPAFFRVQHNDHIGRLSLRAGNYRINLLNSRRLSCARASQNFAEFLQDYNGKLRRPWILNTRTGTFQRGRGSTTGFRVKRAVGPPVRPSGGGTSNKECPGTFRVLGNDRIGKLRLPRGPYLTFALKGSGLSCARVSTLFAQFLENTDGMLPSPWMLNATTATFTNGRRPGFRVKPAN